MSTELQQAFDHQLKELPLAKLTPVRTLPEGVKDTSKYKRIANSIEVTTIGEPHEVDAFNQAGGAA